MTVTTYLTTIIRPAIIAILAQGEADGVIPKYYDYEPDEKTKAPIPCVTLRWASGGSEIASTTSNTRIERYLVKVYVKGKTKSQAELELETIVEQIVSRIEADPTLGGCAYSVVSTQRNHQWETHEIEYLVGYVYFDIELRNVR